MGRVTLRSSRSTRHATEGLVMDRRGHGRRPFLMKEAQHGRRRKRSGGERRPGGGGAPLRNGEILGPIANCSLFATRGPTRPRRASIPEGPRVHPQGAGGPVEDRVLEAEEKQDCAVNPGISDPNLRCPGKVGPGKGGTGGRGRGPGRKTPRPTLLVRGDG